MRRIEPEDKAHDEHGRMRTMRSGEDDAVVVDVCWRGPKCDAGWGGARCSVCGWGRKQQTNNGRNGSKAKRNTKIKNRK